MSMKTPAAARHSTGAGFAGGTVNLLADALDERNSNERCLAPERGLTGCNRAIVVKADGAALVDCGFSAIPESEGDLLEAAPQHSDEARAEEGLAGATENPHSSNPSIFLLVIESICKNY